MSTVLQTGALVKDYGGKIALSGVNLDLESGKIIGLLGRLRYPRGCGDQKARFVFAGAHLSQ